MKMVEGRPPKNALRVYRWDDVPMVKEKQCYRVINDNGDVKETWVSKNRQRILECLMRQPVFAASYVRVSDHVLHLKSENGIDIETLGYRNDPDTGREKYGVYFLRSQVQRVTPEEHGNPPEEIGAGMHDTGQEEV